MAGDDKQTEKRESRDAIHQRSRDGRHAEAPFVEREELLRRRRRMNRLVGLALGVFCAFVFLWILVRIGGQ